MTPLLARQPRPFIPIYYPGDASRCPCCSGRQWHVGRMSAECARCAFVAPLAASSALMRLVRDIARAIADGLGDNFDHAHDSKPHWIETRGESGGRFRDVNEPRKPDYLDAATAALLVALPRIAEVAEKAAADGYWGAIDHKGMAGTGKAIESSIRECLSKLETELRKGGDHG